MSIRWDEFLARFTKGEGLDNATLTTFDAEQDGTELSARLRAAFTFLRTHADRRYSSTTLMKLLNEADNIEHDLALAHNSTFTLGAEQYPRVAIIEVPYAYDELTEVKSGGVLGIAVTLDRGRTLLAVRPERRRQGLGHALVQAVEESTCNPMSAWVHRENRNGQMFLLSLNFIPMQFNLSGAVQYGRDWMNSDDDAQPMRESDLAYAQLVQDSPARARRDALRLERVRRAMPPEPAVQGWDYEPDWGDTAEAETEGPCTCAQCERARRVEDVFA